MFYYPAVTITYQRRQPLIRTDSNTSSSSDESTPTKNVQASKPCALSLSVAKDEKDSLTGFRNIQSSKSENPKLSTHGSTVNRLNFIASTKPTQSISKRLPSLSSADLSMPKSIIPSDKEITSSSDLNDTKSIKGCFPTFKVCKRIVHKSEQKRNTSEALQVPAQDKSKVEVKRLELKQTPATEFTRELEVQSKEAHDKARRVHKPDRKRKTSEVFQVPAQDKSKGVVKRIKVKQTPATEYARELEAQNKEYHDKVHRLLEAIQIDKPTTVRNQGIVHLLDSLIDPDFYQKMRSFGHFEAIFRGLFTLKDLKDPVVHSGILGFVYFASKDPVHTEILLESELVVSFLLDLMPVRALNRHPLLSQLNDIFSRDSTFGEPPAFGKNMGLFTELAVAGLHQMAEAGPRRLRRLQQQVIAHDGVKCIVNCILNSQVMEKAILLLTCLLQEEGHQMRFQLIKEAPLLIPKLLSTLNGSVDASLPYAASKLLVNIAHHHLQAILLVTSKKNLKLVVERILQIHASSESLVVKAGFIMPLVALLISATETPELKVLSHLPLMFIELSLGTPDQLSLLSHLVNLFVCYSDIEHHTCWTLAGYLGALIAFILKGFKDPNFALGQVCAKLSGGIAQLAGFLQQFKTLSSNLESHHLVSYTQPDNSSDAEYYNLPLRSFDKSLAMLLEFLASYA